MIMMMMMMMVLRKALPTIGVNAIMATIDATTMMMAMMIKEEEVPTIDVTKWQCHDGHH